MFLHRDVMHRFRVVYEQHLALHTITSALEPFSKLNWTRAYPEGIGKPDHRWVFFREFLVEGPSLLVAKLLDMTCRVYR